jgi:hypothetical protein
VTATELSSRWLGATERRLRRVFDASHQTPRAHYVYS